MKRKLISLLLAILLVASCALPAAADELQTNHISMEEMEEAMAAMSGAVGAMDDVFTPEEATSIIDMIKGSLETFKTVGSFVTPINGCVTFLKLIGVMKDENKEMMKSIMQQLQAIGDQLSEMDAKLDNLTEQMSEMQASEEFNTRTEKAILMQSGWNEFERTYMEEDMDYLMSQYNSKILDGMQYWCKNPSDRVVNAVDNSQLILTYLPEKDGYALQYSSENGLPSDDTARYLVLDSKLLPGAISWNVNTYRQSIRDAIVENLKARLADPEGAPIASANFPEFAGGGTVTDELLETVADDAVNLLVYRVTAAEVNKSSEFSLETVRQFTNYCTHLLRSGEGVDAMFKVMCLTHSLEGEIADDFTAFCNQMTLKTGAYGAFALNVLGMSDYITDSEKQTLMDTYVHTLNTITECCQNALTGNDNYCYLTGSILAYGQLSIFSSASVETMRRSSIYGYRSMSGNAASTTVYYNKNKSASGTGKLIGDSDAILLGYMLSANGNQLSHEYLNSHLADNYYEDYGATVVSAGSEQNMAISDSTPLYTTKLIGNWFNTGEVISMNTRNKKAGEKYMSYRKKMVGSVLDNNTGTLKTAQTLSALAIYGESNWYWEKDESAIFGGPTVSGFYKEYGSEVIRVEYPSDQIIKHSYSQRVSYNCLLELPYTFNSPMENNPLSSYLDLLGEIHAEEIPQEIEDPEPDPPANPSDDPMEKNFQEPEVTPDEEPGETPEEQSEEQPVGFTGSQQKNTDIAQTGDEGTLLWCVPALLALCGLAITARARKKKN